MAKNFANTRPEAYEERNRSAGKRLSEDKDDCFSATSPIALSILEILQLHHRKDDATHDGVPDNVECAERIPKANRDRPRTTVEKIVSDGNDHLSHERLVAAPKAILQPSQNLNKHTLLSGSEDIVER
jgi:hypothetical protein